MWNFIDVRARVPVDQHGLPLMWFYPTLFYVSVKLVAKNLMTMQWRLDELVQRSRRLLALLPGGEGGSRRVRWRPDARLVRYYTTLGLLDRPAEPVSYTHLDVYKRQYRRGAARPIRRG